MVENREVNCAIYSHSQQNTAQRLLTLFSPIYFDFQQEEIVGLLWPIDYRLNYSHICVVHFFVSFFYYIIFLLLVQPLKPQAQIQAELGQKVRPGQMLCPCYKAVLQSVLMSYEHL